MNGMTYKSVGVDYDAMDPFKRMAQIAGRETAENIARLNGGEFKEFEASRGESVYLIEAAKSYFAHVEEGLGTKNLVADAMYRLTGKSYYDQIAQDTVAMIVNDMITLGALPLSVAMHLAVGDSNWFNDQVRCHDLVNGWKKACDLAGCVWGGGETPTLKGVVNPEAVVLSGSAIGLVKPKERLITGNIQHGDAIIFLESSGIGANGLTMARKIAERKDKFWRKIAHLFLPQQFPLYALPNGYLTKLPDGRTYGETLLDPTYIYVQFIDYCLSNGADIHYAVNITGHGWRKLMRSQESFAYIIEALPKWEKQHYIFDFIQKYGPVSDYEAYANLNMDAGLALYVPENGLDKIWSLLIDCYNHPQWIGAAYAGHIEKSDVKKVIIKPKGLEYLGSTLGVR